MAGQGFQSERLNSPKFNSGVDDGNHPCSSAVQNSRRAALFAAHQNTIDWLWDDHGTFIADPYEPLDGYRLILWHCLAYLAGDARCVEKANRIIVANHDQKPCHFTPGAAVDLLWYYPDQLGAEARALLERYLMLNIPFMSTPDLQVFGYNDNHPYKKILGSVP